MNQKTEIEGGGGARRLSVFARRLLDEWRRLGLPLAAEPPAGRVVLAASGGADSTALLLACEELAHAGRLACGVLVAAHLDHGLRGEAGAEDARWVETLAREAGFECVVGQSRVGVRAAESGDNLEQAARRARYEFLAETARSRGASFVVTAHTLDDQAETILLRLLRGSGGAGLGGMSTVRPLDASAGSPHLVRPLLEWSRREETEDYCRRRGVEPRRDTMNDDERFARVRVRRRLLPLCEAFNPRAAEALSRAARLLREDSAALDDLACRLLEEAAARNERRGQTAAPRRDVNDVAALRAEGADTGADAPPLLVGVLIAAPAALRRRALRVWVGRGRGDLRRVELTHLHGVEKLLEGTGGGRVAELPGGARVERRRGQLIFHRADGDDESRG